MMENGDLALCNDDDDLGLHRDPSSRNKKQRVKLLLKNNLLIILTVISVIVGFAIGFGVRPYKPSADVIMWIGFPGEIFLRLLLMIIVPLIITSVIASTAVLDAKASGKIGGLNTGFVVVFNTMGAAVGTVLGVAIKPGRSAITDASPSRTVTSEFSTGDIIADLLRNIFPDNLIRATMQKTSTAYTSTIKTVVVNTTEGLVNQTILEHHRHLVYANSANILGLIVLCSIFGIATGTIGEKGKPVLEFFKSATDVTFLVIQWLFWLVPIGIASLIAAAIAGLGENIQSVAMGLGFLVIANIAGNLILVVVVTPVVYLIVTRTKPFRLMILQIRVVMMALVAGVSSAIIPEQFKMADRLKVDRSISTFVVPYNATLSRDGSAMFIALSVIFMAQMYNISLSSTQYAMICFLTALCSLAIPAVQSSSIVAIIIIMHTLGLPSEGVGIIFATEWLLDRLRTTTNNSTGVFIVSMINHFCKDIHDEEKRGESRLRSPLNGYIDVTTETGYVDSAV